MTDRRDDRPTFESVVQANAESFRRPDRFPAEAVWSGIERQVRAIVNGYQASVPAWGMGGWLRLAATLVLGVYLGRTSLAPAPAEVPVASATGISSKVHGAWSKVVVAVAAGEEPREGQAIDSVAELEGKAYSEGDIVEDVTRWTRGVVGLATTQARRLSTALVGESR